MPVSDLDILHSAHLWSQTHGDQAVAKARIVEAMRKRGDTYGADRWAAAIVS